MPSSGGLAGQGGRLVEVVLLSLVCWALFFVGLGRFDFIKTEGLRAVVVAEMLEQPGVSMPTVHHRPQTKKPPLYAWTTTALARAMGRFDEQIARLPSAAAGTLLILLLYGVAEWAFRRGAGVIAAALALANPTVLDYSVRAELDMGFALLATLTILLAYPALRRGGTTAVVCWVGCYVAATLAAMWKGPHSLIFLWVTLLAYGWRKRHWQWLWHPGQVTGLVMSLGVLAWWAAMLSSFAGKRDVAQIALIELVSRLVPLSAGDLLSIIYAVPMMAVIVLPASAFVVASFRSGVIHEAGDAPTVAGLPACPPGPPAADTAIGAGAAAGRSPAALARFCAGRFRTWWRAAADNPFAEFLLFWIFANLVWCTIVPAKAPRYWLPLFAPVFLLATYLLRRSALGPPPAEMSPAAQRHFDVTWRCIYGVLGVAGLVGLAAAVIVLIRPGTKVGAVSLGPGWAWLVLGTGWTVMAVIEFARRPVRLVCQGWTRQPEQGRWAWPTFGRCVGLLVIVLAARPAVAEVWWAARARADSQRSNAAAIDAIIPPGAAVHVLGRHELPDVEFYSRRRFEWLGHPDAITSFAQSAGAFCLLRAEDLEDVVTHRGYTYRPELERERAGKRLVLIGIDSVRSSAAGDSEVSPIRRPVRSQPTLE